MPVMIDEVVGDVEPERSAPQEQAQQPAQQMEREWSFYEAQCEKRRVEKRRMRLRAD